MALARLPQPMLRSRAPFLVASTVLWLGCASTPRDQNIGMDASGYMPPIFEAGASPDADEAGGGNGGPGGTGGAAGTGGATGTGGASGTGGAADTDGATDAISDAGAVD
ncbi:MAG: hypothetical protein JWM82_1312 [Myxococcales bacterium]|nr:hypothetical protein [Myxococcales bacterium]